MISFVVPAHNEEAVIEETLTAIFASAGQLNEPFEVLVVDDASTDRTAEIARSSGAAVIAVNLRKISAVRNDGARAARGAILIFSDADPLLPAGPLRLAVDAIRQGAVGGGARVELEGDLPRWAPVSLTLISWVMHRLRFAAGCFVFARRDAFEAVGGFNEEY